MKNVESIEELRGMIGSSRAGEIEEIFLGEEEAREAAELLSTCDLTQFSGLQRLVLVKAKLRALPAKLGDLEALEALVIWGNELETLPESLGQLEALDYVHAASNRLTEIPSCLSTLPGLTDLNIHDNPLRRLSASPMRALSKLDLRSCGLESLGPETANLPALRFFDASSNRIETVDPAIWSCKELCSVNLSSNRLREWPQGAGGVQLTRLILWGNPWGRVPEGLTSLESLSYLDLCQSQLVELPEDIGRLAKLSHLDLSGNQIERLPASMASLTELEWLDLDDNPVIEGVEGLECDEPGAMLQKLWMTGP